MDRRLPGKSTEVGRYDTVYAGLFWAPDWSIVSIACIASNRRGDHVKASIESLSPPARRKPTE